MGIKLSIATLADGTRGKYCSICVATAMHQICALHARSLFAASVRQEVRADVGSDGGEATAALAAASATGKANSLPTHGRELAATCYYCLYLRVTRVCLLTLCRDRPLRSMYRLPIRCLAVKMAQSRREHPADFRQARSSEVVAA